MLTLVCFCKAFKIWLFFIITLPVLLFLSANYDFKEGACGIIPCCVPFICRLVFPVTVIKVDTQTGEYVRDKNGLCKLIKPGEVGEIVGKIRPDAGQAYPGYVNDEATKKKILFNVFKYGDSAFLSGDLVEMDDYGYLYFRDRTGDTYRWKGNVKLMTNITFHC